MEAWDLCDETCDGGGRGGSDEAGDGRAFENAWSEWGD
jgi:hypothetical protein